jgi:2-keto-3-deoxy-L-rhamnonate aldolase RhmA
MMPKHATVIRTTDPVLLDRIVGSGLDWLMLDGEHVSVGLPEMATMLTVVGGRLPCYARVRALDGELINHALDAGATGVIIPNVDTVAQAEDAVHCVRASRWPKAKLVVQAESVAAVRKIEAIVRTPGIEWVLIGPNDLTRSLGIPGQFDDPAYLEAVTTIELACHGAGVPVGIFGMTPEVVKPYESRGFQWLVTGIDLASSWLARGK